jgi:hypothetical protein
MTASADGVLDATHGAWEVAARLSCSPSDAPRHEVWAGVDQKNTHDPAKRGRQGCSVREIVDRDVDAIGEPCSRLLRFAYENARPFPSCQQALDDQGT